MTAPTPIPSWWANEPTPANPESDAPGAHIPGWMSDAELEWLHKQAGGMASVAEIGSLHGRSTFAIATACKGPVYAIDPWDDPDDQAFPSFMAVAGQLANVRAIRYRSPEAASFVPDTDMVFIDGDHSAEALLRDLEAWAPKARILLCGHDAEHAGYPDVSRVVNEWPDVLPTVEHCFPGRVRIAPKTSIWFVES